MLHSLLINFVIHIQPKIEDLSNLVERTLQKNFTNLPLNEAKHKTRLKPSVKYK
jgi:hypothetical protein